MGDSGGRPRGTSGAGRRASVPRSAREEAQTIRPRPWWAVTVADPLPLGAPVPDELPGADSEAGGRESVTEGTRQPNGPPGRGGEGDWEAVRVRPGSPTGSAMLAESSRLPQETSAKAGRSTSRNLIFMAIRGGGE